MKVEASHHSKLWELFLFLSIPAVFLHFWMQLINKTKQVSKKIKIKVYQKDHKTCFKLILQCLMWDKIKVFQLKMMIRVIWMKFYQRSLKKIIMICKDANQLMRVSNNQNNLFILVNIQVLLEMNHFLMIIQMLLKLYRKENLLILSKNNHKNNNLFQVFY